jgi:nicotinate phosphoribosyltransferase
VWAIEEGHPFFPPEPMLRVTAPLPEAQVVETALLAHIGFQTSVASRAVRISAAASGRTVVEFGARRAQGLEAGVLAARAAVIGGCESTSNVEAGRRFGIPVSGTMAHSWVTAFSSELAAFRHYAATFGDRTVLLLDTYDTLASARSVVASGLEPAAVRIDSGDLVELSRQVRAILDAGGLRNTTIFASGDLDEERIAAIVGAGAPVDGFGVGAALSTVSDAPSLGAVYKLVEIERDGERATVMKCSPGKQTLPGRKQVWRIFENGAAVEDVIDLEGAADYPPYARPLLACVMREGRRTTRPASPSELRARSRAAIAALPASVRGLRESRAYPVRHGSALSSEIERQSRGRR